MRIIVLKLSERKTKGDIYDNSLYRNEIAECVIYNYCACLYHPSNFYDSLDSTIDLADFKLSYFGF